MNRRGSLAMLLALVAMLPGGAASAAEGWGNLTITFRYDGEPSRPAKINIEKDPLVRHEPLYDERLLVHREDRGVANVVVYLLDALPADRINWNAAPPKESIVQFTSEQLQFKPRICFLRTDQRMQLINRDPAGHSLHLDWPFGAVMAMSMGQPHLFRADQAEKLPILVGCNIHPWECAWFVIRDNPYCGVSDEHGKLVINNLPVGEWTFQLWHERTREITKARLAGKKMERDKGQLKVHVVAGDNDLGIAELAPEIFGKD